MSVTTETALGALDMAERAFEHIRMLRIALSTIETLGRDGQRTDAHRVMNVIADTARHALDRDQK